MGTHKNCYDILRDVRIELNEYTEAYVQGNDTSGSYSNRYLVQKINDAQRHIYNILLKRKEISEIFLTDASITGASSVFTLPADFGKLVEFRDPDGYKINLISQRDRRVTSSSGDKWTYYRSGNTLVVDASGVVSTCTISYYKKPRDIHTGAAPSGGALSITLSSNGKKIVDYYNGMVIENVTSDWFDTISDYTAARVATIGTETAVAGDFYGLVPDIPEMFHEFIAPLAVIMVRSGLKISQEKSTGNDMSLLADGLNDAIAAYTGQEDVPAEEYFMD